MNKILDLSPFMSNEKNEKYDNEGDKSDQNLTKKEEEEKESKSEIKSNELKDTTQGASSMNEDNSGVKKKSSSFLTSSIPKKEKTEVEPEAVEIDLEKIQEEYIEKNLKDEVIFKSKCKLYYLNKEKKKLEEKGEGIIMINKDVKTDMNKIVMIRSSIMRHGCNHFINPRFKMDKSLSVPNAYLWATTEDTVECDGNVVKNTTQLFMAKFDEEETGERFLEVYNRSSDSNKSLLDAKDKK